VKNTSYKYFTTPIYYANGAPHAGHIYSTLFGTILKNHFALRGDDVCFLTGLDEHGEAVAEKAQEKNISPQALVDQMAVDWKNCFEKFNVGYDVFLRTTNEEHKKNVTQILEYCHKKGDIYFGEHTGYYCVKCEGFLNATERDENNACLIHKRPTELRKEGNYFFRTSKYKDILRTHIKNKDIVEDDGFINELLGLLDQLEGDLSISRPKTRLTWGIDLPFDKEHVAYVWFDALPNYITGIGGVDAVKTDNSKASSYWKNVHHILGKDILKFHGIFWPAMCLSLDIPLPKLIVTGWLLKDGHKMSKSLGNVLTIEQILHYGRDAFVNYVFRATNPGGDIDISWRSYLERFNADLANGIGNLAARTLSMCEKYCENKIPAFHSDALTMEQKELATKACETIKDVYAHMDRFHTAAALQTVSQLITLADKYISSQKPWELAKDTSRLQELHNLLATVMGVLKVVANLLWPFFPEKMSELLVSLGENATPKIHCPTDKWNFFAIASHAVIPHIPKLYGRLDVAAELKIMEDNSASTTTPSAPVVKAPVKTSATKAPVENKVPAENTTEHIQFTDFAKVNLRVGTVIQAEIVEGSDKLLRLMVCLGDGLGTKQIFSGIREWIKPEDIVNKKVLVVANLAPRKMRFGISEGMLLSAENPQTKVCRPIYLEEVLEDGSLLS